MILFETSAGPRDAKQDFVTGIVAGILRAPAACGRGLRAPAVAAGCAIGLLAWSVAMERGGAALVVNPPAAILLTPANCADRLRSRRREPGGMPQNHAGREMRVSRLTLCGPPRQS